jgi:hypothetical protein
MRIAGECPDHEKHRISHQEAACQLVHDVIRKTARGGGIHNAPGMVLVAMDTGSQSQTSKSLLESLLSSIPEDEAPDPRKQYT